MRIAHRKSGGFTEKKSQIWKRTESKRLTKTNRPDKCGAYPIASIVLYYKLIWVCGLAMCEVACSSSPDSFFLAAVWMLLSRPQRSIDLTQTTKRSCPNENTLGIKEQSDTPCRVCFVSSLWPGLSAPFIRSVCTRGSFVIFAPDFADTAVGQRVGSRPALCFLSPNLKLHLQHYYTWSYYDKDCKQKVPEQIPLCQFYSCAGSAEALPACKQWGRQTE